MVFDSFQSSTALYYIWQHFGLTSLVFLAPFLYSDFTFIDLTKLHLVKRLLTIVNQILFYLLRVLPLFFIVHSFNISELLY